MISDLALLSAMWRCPRARRAHLMNFSLQICSDFVQALFFSWKAKWIAAIRFNFSRPGRLISSARSAFIRPLIAADNLSARQYFYFSSTYSYFEMSFLEVLQWRISSSFEELLHEKTILKGSFEKLFEIQTFEFQNYWFRLDQVLFKFSQRQGGSVRPANCSFRL